MTAPSPGERRTLDAWRHLGATDPDWAVLTEPSKRHGGWENDLDAFYETGRATIRSLLAELPAELQRERALDWGSGTGRLTFALADHFGSVVGVDISEPMITLARRRARERGASNVSFESRDGFRPAGDHDLAISLLTLQHAPDLEVVARDIATMVSALRSGGWLMLHIPERPLSLRARIQPRYRALRLFRGFRVPETALRGRFVGISMLWISERRGREMIANSGADVIDVRSDEHDGRYSYTTYIARKL